MSEKLRPQNQDFLPQEVRSAFVSQANLLKERDHPLCGGSKRDFVRIGALDLNLITAERYFFGEYQHPTSTFYSHRNGEFKKDSSFSYGPVDPRLSYGDMWRMDIEFNPDNSPFSFVLKFDEDRVVGFKGIFDKGELYARYQDFMPGEPNAFPKPRLVALIFAFDKEKAEEEFHRVWEKWDDDGKIPLTDETRRVYWDEVKPINLYPQPDPVDEFMKKGEETVSIQGQDVSVRYNIETSMIEVRFPVKGRDQFIAVPYEMEPIQELKGKIVKDRDGLDESLFDRSTPKKTFELLGFKF